MMESQRLTGTLPEKDVSEDELHHQSLKRHPLRLRTRNRTKHSEVSLDAQSISGIYLFVAIIPSVAASDVILPKAKDFAAEFCGLVMSLPASLRHSERPQAGHLLLRQEGKRLHGIISFVFLHPTFWMLPSRRHSICSNLSVQHRHPGCDKGQRLCLCGDDWKARSRGNVVGRDEVTHSNGTFTGPSGVNITFLQRQDPSHEGESSVNNLNAIRTCLYSIRRPRTWCIMHTLVPDSKRLGVPSLCDERFSAHRRRQLVACPVAFLEALPLTIALFCPAERSSKASGETHLIQKLSTSHPATHGPGKVEYGKVEREGLYMVEVLTARQAWAREKLEEFRYEWDLAYPPYDTSIFALEEAILQASFRDIAIEGTGLSTLIDAPTGFQGEIQGPVVLELVHLTDVGVSAFDLEAVRQRRQRIEFEDTVSRIRAMIGRRGLPEDRPLPQYPRRRLKLFLSDGFRELEAVECELLAGLALGQTCMGTKLRLTNFSIVDGIARLYAENVEILGGKVERAERQHSVRLFEEMASRMEDEYRLLYDSPAGEVCYGLPQHLNTYQPPSVCGMQLSFPESFSSMYSIHLSLSFKLVFVKNSAVHFSPVE
ncbi:hypothetical protein NMY22_g5499 [Coprinellus aureogranulatus]|nr:hypothetical protein NMY22_g5499 [Coprinellus aureogranulatus]